jgi:hypothetical protein
MSKLFIISEEEKDRILNLHESATNRQYLPEQQVKKGLFGDPYEYMEKDGKYYFRNLKKGETKWTSANKNQSDVIKTKIFKNSVDTKQPIKKPEKKINKIKTKVTDPSNINSYPSCVRFSKPINDSSTLEKIGNMFGGNFGDWFIKGNKFYEGYSFFNDGTYVSVGNSKKGKYSCSTNNKVILDIASKALNPNTRKKGDYKYSPRIDAEVQHIKNRKMDDTPFFIYDPKENLIYLFNTGGVYVASSSVVDGADTQKGLSDAKIFTSQDWCKVSKLNSKPYLCTDPKTNEKTQPYYGPISKLASRFLPKGIYTIKGLSYDEGYVGGGKGGNKNTFRLKPIKLDGTITAAAEKSMSAAIHGIPNTNERLVASKDLQNLLQSDINSGKVPEEYLNNIKAITQANQSFGCIGIPASFVDNPKVQSIIKSNINKIKVFAMGEDSQDFLVQNDYEKSNDDQSGVA